MRIRKVFTVWASALALLVLMVMPAQAANPVASEAGGATESVGCAEHSAAERCDEVEAADETVGSVSEGPWGADEGHDGRHHKGNVQGKGKGYGHHKDAECEVDHAGDGPWGADEGHDGHHHKGNVQGMGKGYGHHKDGPCGTDDETDVDDEVEAVDEPSYCDKSDDDEHDGHKHPRGDCECEQDDKGGPHDDDSEKPDEDDSEKPEEDESETPQEDDDSEKPDEDESEKPEEHDSEKPEEHESAKPEEHKSEAVEEEKSETPVSHVDKEAPEVEVVEEAAEELAFTGLNAGVALAAGLGLVLAGGGALYASRRRQYES